MRGRGGREVMIVLHVFWMGGVGGCVYICGLLEVEAMSGMGCV